MRKVVAALAAALMVVAVAAGSAFAGEVTGNGKTLWTNTDEFDAPHTLHGNSECAFSGRNDENVLFAPGDPEYQAERTQSWGQTIKHTDHKGGFGGFNPGLFCNGSGKKQP
jgi:hypothetical protein